MGVITHVPVRGTLSRYVRIVYPVIGMYVVLGSDWTDIRSRQRGELLQNILHVHIVVV